MNGGWGGGGEGGHMFLFQKQSVFGKLGVFERASVLREVMFTQNISHAFYYQMKDKDMESVS